MFLVSDIAKFYHSVFHHRISENGHLFGQHFTLNQLIRCLPGHRTHSEIQNLIRKFYDIAIRLGIFINARTRGSTIVLAVSKLYMLQNITAYVPGEPLSPEDVTKNAFRVQVLHALNRFAPRPMTRNMMHQKLSIHVKDLCNKLELDKLVDAGILQRTAGIRDSQLYSIREDYDMDYGKLLLIN